MVPLEKIIDTAIADIWIYDSLCRQPFNLDNRQISKFLDGKVSIKRKDELIFSSFINDIKKEHNRDDKKRRIKKSFKLS